MTEIIESENIDSENIIKAQIVAIFKNGKLWTPPATSKRTNPETGIYNNKPNDPEYFNKYYNEKNRVPVVCPHCTCMVPKLTLLRHMRSNKCKKKANLKIINIDLVCFSDLD
jgi:hypothetical protein